jgi:endoglucanase
MIITKTYPRSKKIIIALVLAISCAVSIVGLRFAHALTSPPPLEDVTVTQLTPNAPNTAGANSQSVDTAKGKEENTAATDDVKKTAPSPTQSGTTQKATYAPISTASPKGKKLYVDASAKIGQPVEIASQATAIWLGGWNADVRQTANANVSAAAAQGALATFVLYNIPARDCGSYSAGGASGSQSYRAWVRSVAAGIGTREAIVIVEPDALPGITCLSKDDQASRYADIADAVNVLATQTKSFIYLDAGNSSWVDANTMVSRLEKANIAQARGFSMNVSGFQSTQSTTQYGEKISAKNGKSYVIDTSRNGQGPNGNEWCNPRGRGLGKKPTTATPGNLDAYLWVKIPGESDGECNNGPSAGTWWDDYAQELIRNAVY